MSGEVSTAAQYVADAGGPFEGTVTGVWSLPKPNSVVAFAVGEKVFWDNATSLCKKTATGFFLVGFATVAAAATDSTVAVRLDGTSCTYVMPGAPVLALPSAVDAQPPPTLEPGPELSWETMAAEILHWGMRRNGSSSSSIIF